MVKYCMLNQYSLLLFIAHLCTEIVKSDFGRWKVALILPTLLELVTVAN